MSRKIVEDVLHPRVAKELWTAGYRPALPIVPQDFALGSVLPAVLYMMRRGHRRGRGQFAKVFGASATIERVSEKLSLDECFVGFQGDVQRAILGDLLLAFCLENRGRVPGRKEPVQRVFPTHYFSSWVDLPATLAHLRGVPEMVVSLLARQSSGAILSSNGGGYYPVGTGFMENRLLYLLGPGTFISGPSGANVKSDHFDEGTELGIDQLLMVRLALALSEPPAKVGGEKPDLPNQSPVAQAAADQFHEDLNVFLRAYGDIVPRQSLVPMLESALAVGLTNIYLSTHGLALHWASTGVVPSRKDQKPWPLFLDCSVSVDPTLRRLSEGSLDDLVQSLGRMPITMMCLQILEQRARDEGLEMPVAEPDPTARLGFLGDLLCGRLRESHDIERDIRKDCNRLAQALTEIGETEAAEILRNETIAPPWRLAEGMVYLMGQRVHLKRFREVLDACLIPDQPNGLARKRQSTVNGKRKERRSLVLTNSALDFLVHRHLRKGNKDTRPTALSLDGFTRILRERYGFYVSEAPPGMPVPVELLQRNRSFLERRLRDLGLLTGVNDAESMKRLRARFVRDGGQSD